MLRGRLGLWFVVGVVLSVGMMVGCQQGRWAGSPAAPSQELPPVLGGAPVAPGETVRLGNGAAELRFSISLDGAHDLSASLRSSTDTGSPTTAATVTVTLVTVKTGFAAWRENEPATATHTRDVPVIAGVASVTFTGVDPNPALALIEIASGSFAGFNRFRGALDLATGSNRLIVVPRGSRLPRDVVAHVFEQFLLDRASLSRTDREFVARTAAVVAELGRYNEGVYEAAWRLMRGAVNNVSGTNRSPGAPETVGASADVGDETESQVVHPNTRLFARNFTGADPDSGDTIGFADFELYDSATATATSLVWTNSACMIDESTPKTAMCEVSAASGTFHNAWATFNKIPGYSTPFWLRARFHDSRGGIGSWSALTRLQSDYGPTLRWQRVIGGEENEWGTAILTTSDDGVIVGGFGESLPEAVGYSRSVGAVYKFDRDGNKVWHQLWGGTEYSNQAGGTSDVRILRLMPYNAGFVALCESSADTGEFVGNDVRAGAGWLLEFSPAGARGRMVKLPGAVLSVQDFTTALDGKVWVVGANNPGAWLGATNLAGQGEEFPIEPDGTPTLVSSGITTGFDDTVATPSLFICGRQFPNVERGYRIGYDRVVPGVPIGDGLSLELPGSSSDEAHQIARSTDGCFLILTTTQSEAVSGFRGSSDVAIAKVRMTPNGTATYTPQIVWHKAYGGADAETAGRLAPTPDGGCVFVAVTTSNPEAAANGPKGPMLRRGEGNGKRKVWVVKLDANGAVQWQKVLGGAGSYGSEAGDVQPTADGGYVVVSSLTGEYFIPTGATGRISYREMWVVRLDP